MKEDKNAEKTGTGFVSAIYKREAVMAPTRICSICGTYEYPNAMKAYSFSWICPECGERLKKLLYKEGEA